MCRFILLCFKSNVNRCYHSFDSNETKAILTQVGLDPNIRSKQAKDYQCFDGNRHVCTHLEHRQKRERRQEALEARETIQNATKHYLQFKNGPFAHERTIQFNLDIATYQRPHKHGNILLLFARANERDGLKTDIRLLTMLLSIHS